jgi:hypothetical protein
VGIRAARHPQRDQEAEEDRHEESGVTDTDRHVHALRDQLAGLISQIDSSAKPRPDKVNPADHRLPGPEWHPEKDWVVRCVDNDHDLPTSIYITPPALYDDGDLEALRTDDARKFAMAILAACDWADGLSAGVTPLDTRRSA